MEHKTLSFEIKAVDYTGRTLEGYAAAFGNIDQVGDIIHKGAFRKTLVDRNHSKSPVMFLWQHDPGEPIGRMIEAREDDNGLFIKAVISDTQRGRDALALLKDGAISRMSIGYDAIKGGTEYTKGKDGQTIRNLREIKLYEFSLVTFPANEQAIVTAVKQQESDQQTLFGKPILYENGTTTSSASITLGRYVDILQKQQDVIPSEGKPYANVPDDKTDEMDRCVEKVMASGKEKNAAIAICYASIVEGKSLADLPFILDPAPEVKAGRTISRATLARLKAARETIDELCKMGDSYDDEEDEPEEVDEPEKKSIIQSQLNTAAGPVKPPTEMLLKLIDLELSELHH